MRTGQKSILAIIQTMLSNRKQIAPASYSNTTNVARKGPAVKGAQTPKQSLARRSYPPSVEILGKILREFMKCA